MLQGVYPTLEMSPNPGPLYGQLCAHSHLVSVRLVWTPFYVGESAVRKHARCWGQREQSLDSSLLSLGCYLEASGEGRPQAPAEKGWARDSQGSPRLSYALLKGRESAYGLGPPGPYGFIISGVLVYPPQA